MYMHHSADSKRIRSFMLCMSSFCYAFVCVCLLVPCGHLLGKGWPLGSRLCCLIVKSLLSNWYPGSGVVLDCIDSWFLPFFLLWCQLQAKVHVHVRARSTGYLLSVVRLTARLDMTIAVDWDVKQQTKQGVYGSVYQSTEINWKVSLYVNPFCCLFVESLTELLWLPYAYWDQGFLGRPNLAIQMEWLDALIDKFTLLSSKIVSQLTRVLYLLHLGGSRGEQGVRTPWKITKI